MDPTKKARQEDESSSSGLPGCPLRFFTEIHATPHIARAIADHLDDLDCAYLAEASGSEAAANVILQSRLAAARNLAWRYGFVPRKPVKMYRITDAWISRINKYQFANLRLSEDCGKTSWREAFMMEEKEGYVSPSEKELRPKKPSMEIIDPMTFKMARMSTLNVEKEGFQSCYLVCKGGILYLFR